MFECGDWREQEPAGKATGRGRMGFRAPKTMNMRTLSAVSVCALMLSVLELGSAETETGDQDS